MKRERGRPRKLSTKVKELIARHALADKTPREQLAEKLIKEIESLGERAPTLETIMRMISKARNHPVSPMDQRFSLGILASSEKAHEFSPAALRVILKVNRARAPDGMSIREALWMARLSALHLSPDDLMDAAHLYAFYEKAAEAAGIHFDTTGLDFEVSSSEPHLWKFIPDEEGEK